MKFRLLMILSCLAGILSYPAHASGLTWTNNLINNPGAETGSLESWTTDDPQAVYAAQSVSQTTGLVLPNTGEWFFSMDGTPVAPSGVTASRILFQDIDISTYSSIVDANQLLVEASVYYQNEDVPEFEGADFPQLTLYFLDEFGSSIDEFQARLQSPNLNWVKATLSGAIPTGTRSLRYELLGEKNEVNFINVFFDDASLRLAIVAEEIEIDIRPGNDENPVNPRSKGKLKVAVLTDEDFEASTVDADSIQFGPDKAKPVHYRLKDVDHDGDMDLLLKFKIRDTGIECGDKDATLTGETFDAQIFTGTDSIKTVGCKKPEKSKMMKHKGK